MIISLKRFSYSATETEGVLHVGLLAAFPTIEQPWRPNPNGAKGGKPSASCIPDGMYRMMPHTRPNGDKVWIIFNPDLGVHRMPQDHNPGEGRDLILIHKGNWVTDIVGCIAPGRTRRPMIDPDTGVISQAVTSSGHVMKLLHELLGNGPHILSITNETGASDVNVS